MDETQRSGSPRAEAMLVELLEMFDGLSGCTGSGLDRGLRYLGWLQPVRRAHAGGCVACRANTANRPRADADSYTGSLMALRRSRVLNAILALVAPFLLAAAATAGATTDLLLLLPAILAFLSLLAARYLGEERLARLMRAHHERHRRRIPAAMGWPVPARCRRLAFTPRGGSLIAAALAVRPPPVAVPAA